MWVRNPYSDDIPDFDVDILVLYLDYVTFSFTSLLNGGYMKGGHDVL